MPIVGLSSPRPSRDARRSVDDMNDLSGKKVAFVATDGYEDSELTSPWDAVTSAGATAVLIAPQAGSIEGKNGHTQTVDLTTDAASASDYDALVLPGGVVNADHLRMDERAVAFARAFFEASKPVAAICHAAWTLIEADVVKGRTLTSYPSLKTDLRNAGAEWVDQEVVVDQGFVTSRTPDDLPAFNDKVVEEIAEGRHSGQHA
jgi:protease I